MLKFLLGICVVAFSSFCGYIFAKKYKKRKDFFTQMSYFNEKFLNEVAYYKRPLSEFFHLHSRKDEFGAFSKFFLDGLGNSDLRSNCQKYLNELACFSMDEIEFILGYFFSLGKEDSNAQAKYFTAIKSALVEYMGRAKEDYNRYGNLYVKLGFLCGLTILILIV